MARHRCVSRAFTLVELLVVIGIVALLVASVVPTVSRAWAAARFVKCAANMHQVMLALSAYAAQSGGWYPPNTATPTPGRYWYDDARVGSILPATRPPVPAGKPGGGPYVCPCDDGPAYLSYAMNVWASSAIDAGVLAQQQGFASRWTPRDGPAAQLILLVEAYSGTGTPAGYWAPPTVGVALAATPVTTAGQRFGGAGGVLISARRFGVVTSEVNFMRHRTPGTPGVYTQPRGRCNIGYADGHVEAKTDADLVTPGGLSTGGSRWTPTDWQVP